MSDDELIERESVYYADSLTSYSHEDWRKYYLAFKSGFKAAEYRLNRIVLQEIDGTYVLNAKITMTTEVERDSLRTKLTEAEALIERLAQALENYHRANRLSPEQPEGCLYDQFNKALTAVAEWRKGKNDEQA